MTPAAIEPFQHALERWHDFYLLAGTAAATLMGLLFVSLSIHLEKIVAEGGAHLEAISREAFASFIIVLAGIPVFFLWRTQPTETAREPVAQMGK